MEKRAIRGRGSTFWESADARQLSLLDIARLSDEDALKLFEGVRWCDTQGEPVCPKCGCLTVYRHKGKRKIFTCKGCAAQFSATSGTIFHSRKLHVRDILFAIAIFVNGVKGHSALQLSRELNCQYKTAFVLAHKIREALGKGMDEREASGTVEVDGAYFGGYIKPANYWENRRDRRLAKNQNGKRRVVVIMRERGGRTLPFVVKHEAQSVTTLERRIRPGSTVHADEANSWNPLHYAGLNVKRINHKYAYSDEGACTNNAESFFSRIRRAEIGMHHHIAGPYLEAYAKEMAWREDARRIDNGTQFLLMALAAIGHEPSAIWKGYWQKAKTSKISRQ
ncbi:IS1595 family transposase [Chenggangzhangella methanolivorans]|uniref:IS1595 family transposase n=1 Tax=Chenggangzhangella methanolivorans TaxID=1437009 RepID=A0A9E6RK15_9HYPH|nr:IS1595 family transposase [Chenggangzhangella methanolivorans]